MVWTLHSPGRWVGTGSPEGALSAPVADEAVRLDGGAGTTHYYKEAGTGSTGWVTVTTAGSGGGAPASQLDADGTILDVDAIADGSVLRRSGTGVIGATCTAAGYAILDDADAAAQRTTLGLAAIAASGSAADLGAGIIPDARMPNLTGDVTTSEGAVATTIVNDAVTNPKLANVASSTFKGRATSGTGDPEDLTATQATALLDLRTDALKGLMPALVGRVASRSTTTVIGNTLTQVVGATLAADTMKAGTVFRFRAMGLLTNSTTASTSVLTIRVASASLGTPIVGSWSVALGTTARTNNPFVIDGEMTVLTTGAAGTAWGMIAVTVNTGTALAAPTTMITSAVTISTTASRVIELAFVSGAASTAWTFTSAYIECVHQP